ncbi:MAG TPA: polymer-forming cytoskeletal protein [Vicinamibacterales bacterium]|nr:polymer-forming cytoskeletal protein [Vicinamibacterales bacterium]
MATTIARGITVKGTIHAAEPIAIAGTVKGDVLAADHDVTVESGADVNGAVTARTITVLGRSSGRLVAREVVRVLESAFVRADIASPRLALEDGAMFSGSVEPARSDAALRVAAYRNRTEAPEVPATT